MARRQATENKSVNPEGDEQLPSEVETEPGDDNIATPDGDTVRTGNDPALVDVVGAEPPKAGELRKAGYHVDESLKAGDVPVAITSDTPRTDPEPALVEGAGTTVHGLPGDDKGDS